MQVKNMIKTKKMNDYSVLELKYLDHLTSLEQKRKVKEWTRYGCDVRYLTYLISRQVREEGSQGRVDRQSIRKCKI